jgi:hypothetical protein
VDSLHFVLRRRLANLQESTACYRDSFTCITYSLQNKGRLIIRGSRLISYTRVPIPHLQSVTYTPSRKTEKLSVDLLQCKYQWDLAICDNSILSYYNSRHYPLCCPLSSTRDFGDWVMSLSSGRTYSVRPSRKSLSPECLFLLKQPGYVPLVDEDRIQSPK